MHVALPDRDVLQTLKHLFPLTPLLPLVLFEFGL
jgi:hypothetical protein